MTDGVAHDLVLLDLNKNGRERVKVQVREYRGARFCDVRLFVTGKDGACIPTPKGVSLRHDMLGAIIEALQRAETLLIVDSVLPSEGRASH